MVRREIWLPSRRTIGISLVAGLLVLWAALVWVHPFLAITQKSGSNLLIVEGWLPAPGLKAAIVEYRTSNYREIVTSGVPAHEDSGNREGVTYAEWGEQRLRRFGLGDSPITAVPCFIEQRDRTYSSALAVRDWLVKNRPGITSVDVLSYGPHARRSRLLFQKALGDGIQVGIVSVRNPEYDPTHWWRSSEGVREVVGEALAYLYARVFFWPRSSPSSIS